ncbi:MAG: PEP-CTERM sorting domain-containing protein [Burkholderiales bacterium]|nr:PEP-CTERM sorting domain-containing protein [Burkholderiales bacterium]MDE1929254.1 PEP-CTERM sorting domain-containing protein [Burkholderiales bacterium]MDE2161179.1 PEP-CTERM sorting domain-containing protein [Burkholderiales bacterium]MDE2501819.1 PEP-CTERM sorting domain-containing protein [Burkholderiales bacterium]
MKNSARMGYVVAAAAWVCAGSAHATDVYCPGNTYPLFTTSSSPPPQSPTATRYIDVSGGALPGYCYFQNGNMTFTGAKSILPTVIATDPGLLTGLTQITELTGGSTASNAFGGVSVKSGGISGGYTVSSSLWSSYSTILIGFHFGSGSGNPDSFLMQLAQDNTSGTWTFNPATIANGLSNFYLLGVPGGGTNTGGSSPEPASLALVSLGLLGAAYARKRRRV